MRRGVGEAAGEAVDVPLRPSELDIKRKKVGPS